MDCKKCKNEVSFESKFCSDCGSPIHLDYSRELWFEIYFSISNQTEGIGGNNYLSDHYKKYLRKTYNNSHLMMIMMSFCIFGYNIRLTEEYFGILKKKNIPNEIKDILKSKADEYDKIEKIAKYFDANSELRNPSSNFFKQYAIFDWEESRDAYLYFLNDFYNQMQTKFDAIKFDQDTLEEMIGITSAFGYYFRLAEEIVKTS